MRYYYLIATLPEISPGNLPKDLNIPELIELIRDNLEDNDKEQLNYLLYMNDNANLINHLCQRKKGFSIFPAASPSYYELKELQELVRSRFELPDYMADFLVRFEDQASTLSIQSLEESLWFNFYKEINEKCTGFIKEFYAFDRMLRSIVSHSNSKLFPEQNLTSQLTKGFSIQGNTEYEEIDNHIDELNDGLESKQPKFIQITMDKIRWEFADRYQPTEFFSNTRVFAYFLQLMMLEKWIRLREQEQPAKINEMIMSIISKNESLENILA